MYMETATGHKKKIIILGSIILLLTTVFVLRDKIFWRPAPEKFETPGGQTSSIQEPAATSQKQISAADKQSDTGRQAQIKTTLPLYTGRDPREVNPSPDAIKLFDEKAKNQMYADIRLYGQTVKENPEYVSGWLQVGLLKKVIGDYVGTQDAWEYAARVRPTEATTFKNLGELYWHYLPDYPRSEKNFRKAIENKPDDPTTYVSLSELYRFSYKEKVSMALTILFEGLKTNPDNSTLVKAIADFYGEQGNNEKALEWWQKALQLDPSNSSIKQTIEDLKKLHQ